MSEGANVQHIASSLYEYASWYFGLIYLASNRLVFDNSSGI